MRMHTYWTFFITYSSEASNIDQKIKYVRKVQAWKTDPHFTNTSEETNTHGLRLSDQRLILELNQAGPI